MDTQFSIFRILLLITAAEYASCASYKVDVTVHYELICPHSRAVVIEQAIPAWRMLSSIMTLELIPYGNTKMILNDNSTVPPSTTFKCQHEKRECDGDTLMSCSIALLPKEISFAFIECMYQHRKWWKPAENAPECAKELKIDFQLLSECGNSSFGRALQWQSARKVNKLKPKHTFVPWILIDGKHTEDIQNRSFSNMMQLVCDSYQGLKPDVCKSEEIEDVVPSHIGYTLNNVTGRLTVLQNKSIDATILMGKGILGDQNNAKINKTMTTVGVKVNNETILELSTTHVHHGQVEHETTIETLQDATTQSSISTIDSSAMKTVETQRVAIKSTTMEKKANVIRLGKNKSHAVEDGDGDDADESDASKSKKKKLKASDD